MKICTSREEMLAVSTGWAADGQTVCLVPTMGNLHDGHLSLLDIAARHGERVITSIYVNPLQFAPHEDFNSYPRTVQADLDKLAATGKCDAVFMPQTMYGHGHATSITPGGAAEGLESVSRPHFFEGVATVVYQLFVQTAAQKAIFGEKDFQQLRVIQQMVRDLHMGIEVIPAPTAREADGLAMSSRNSYLDDQRRAAAPALYQALQEAAEALRGGDVAACAAGRPLLRRAARVRRGRPDRSGARRLRQAEPAADDGAARRRHVLGARERVVRCARRRRVGLSVLVLRPGALGL